MYTTICCISRICQPCDPGSSRNGTGVTLKEEIPPAGETGDQNSFPGTNAALILQQILLEPAILSGFLSPYILIKRQI